MKESYVDLNVYSWFADTNERINVATLPHTPPYAASPVNLAPADFEQEINDEVWFGMAAGGWTAETPEDAFLLRQRFNNWLGYDVEASQGDIITYQGKIWEMTLREGYLIRQRNYDRLANVVTVKYSGGSYTTPAEQESVDRYGKRTIAFEDTGLDATAAQNRAEVELQRRSWPRDERMFVKEYEPFAKLEFVCRGHLHTAAWNPAPSTTVSGATAISIVISDVLTNDCPHLTAGDIETNGETISTLPAGDALTVLLELVKLGGAAVSGIRPEYHFVIREWGIVDYVKFSYTPIHYLESGGLFSAAGAGAGVTAHQARPGVIRDESILITEVEPGSPYEQSNDGRVNKLVSKQGDILPGFRGDGVEDSDLLGVSGRGHGGGHHGGRGGSSKPPDNWEDAFWEMASGINNNFSRDEFLSGARRARGGK